MLEHWEKHSYREQPEYNPQDYCARCGNYFGYYLLDETTDRNGKSILVCRNCLEVLKIKGEKNGKQ